MQAPVNMNKLRRNDGGKRSLGPSGRACWTLAETFVCDWGGTEMFLCSDVRTRGLAQAKRREPAMQMCCEQLVKTSQCLPFAMGFKDFFRVVGAGEKGPV